MDEKITDVVEDATDAVSVLSGENASAWFDLSDWRLQLLLGLVALVLLLWMMRRMRRFLRRRKGPTIHPKLQKYERRSTEPDPTLKAKRREEAAKIIATSSTSTIAGFEIVEQLEAVIVDGFKGPEDALEGLKAAAAMKGANAVVNVHRDRVDAGTCSAAGDAVTVRRLVIEADPEAVGGESASETA